MLQIMTLDINYVNLGLQTVIWNIQFQLVRVQSKE